MGGDNHGDLKLLGLLLIAAIVLVGILVIVAVPFGEGAVAALDAGLDLKESVVWGFGTTVALFVLFALVAGDGLLGELQFMLGSFFVFFAVITLLIAWVF
ncbi:hypothetical protein Thimo_2139 [Thioflavicoccus mobilis 8321]|uniref:Uncharacterized protein n=1 Tax=Thioflavicoccus mobilis 8321 TaxID=765912 RepID=L0GZT5_9GAMM|nr:hypothetical protein [Thioflavicoccus mobilis]AGA90890.1 hypothetical protein Thimo_2139 [Thioflavicoccus mobilis 8321]